MLAKRLQSVRALLNDGDSLSSVVAPEQKRRAAPDQDQPKRCSRADPRVPPIERICLSDGDDPRRWLEDHVRMVMPGGGVEGRGSADTRALRCVHRLSKWSNSGREEKCE
jgi:hypothetical protein